jgi:hypothetical protein
MRPQLSWPAPPTMPSPHRFNKRQHPRHPSSPTGPQPIPTGAGQKTSHRHRRILLRPRHIRLRPRTRQRTATVLLCRSRRNPRWRRPIPIRRHRRARSMPEAAAQPSPPLSSASSAPSTTGGAFGIVVLTTQHRSVGLLPGWFYAWSIGSGIVRVVIGVLLLIGGIQLLRHRSSGRVMIALACIVVEVINIPIAVSQISHMNSMSGATKVGSRSAANADPGLTR